MVLDILHYAKDITQPISLAAFAIACVVIYLVNKSNNYRKAIESAKKEDRANALMAIAEKTFPDIQAVPETQRAALMQQELGNRMRKHRTFAAIFILVLTLFAFLINKQLSGYGAKTNGQDTSAHLLYPKNLVVSHINLIDTSLIRAPNRIVDNLSYYEKRSATFTLNAKDPKILLIFLSRKLDFSFSFKASKNMTLANVAHAIIYHFKFDEIDRENERDANPGEQSATRWEVYINSVSIPEDDARKTLKQLRLQDSDRISLNCWSSRWRNSTHCPILKF